MKKEDRKFSRFLSALIANVKKEGNMENDLRLKSKKKKKDSYVKYLLKKKIYYRKKVNYM